MSWTDRQWWVTYRPGRRGYTIVPFDPAPRRYSPGHTVEKPYRALGPFVHEHEAREFARERQKEAPDA